ncbi:MAG: formyltransferase family protein [Halobacteriales archaeon]
MALFEADRPPRVVVFFSGGASGFRYLHDHDPAYGDAYEVVAGFTDEPDCPGVDHLDAADVPVVARDLRAFYEERGAETGDMDVRRAFDRGTAETIGEFDPDLLLLSGYMWRLTAPVINGQPVLNVHPADLTVTDGGERVYVGADPVYDAVVAGEDATRSSVHLVTEAVDEGPVLVRSKPHPVNREMVSALRRHGAEAALRNYVDAHQEWMKWEGDGPALAAALELMASGRVAVEDGDAVVDGTPGPYDLG